VSDRFGDEAKIPWQLRRKSEEQLVNENDDEDVDWGEPERRARMLDPIAEVCEMIRTKKYVLAPLRKLPERFDVQTFSEGHDTMEFTLLEPETGKVRVTDNFYFTEPTECTLIGSEDDIDGNGATIPGVIKHNAKLVFEIGGQRLKENGPELRVMRLTLYYPDREPLSLWT
jgi:hypothetical protein